MSIIDNIDIDDMHINIHEKLNTAVVQQNLEKVKKYLAQGADANYVRFFDDRPALMQAMKHTYDEDGCKYEPNMEIIKILIENGANVNQTDEHKYTPLHYAVELKNKGTEIIKLLIEKGADVNAKNSSGDTPLHRAVYNSLENTKMLIDNGARVNDMNWGNSTALDIAEFETDKIDKKTKEELKNLIISNGGERSEYSKYSKYKNYDEYRIMTKSLPTENEIKIKPKIKAKTKTKTKQKTNDFGMGM